MNVNRKKLRKIICAALALGLTSWYGGASAQEQEYVFDQVIVTALRTESKDLNTPAYVHVYTEEQLKKTGSNNLLDALKFTEGVTYDGYGASGHLYSSMTAKATIRGMDRGTLVLVNGVPTNLSGYYSLERIPLDNIEKVEIVKGGASVLYGSAAMGGVINIITKDKVANSITVEQGSFERNSQAMSLQLGNLGVYASHREQGDIGQVSDPWSSTGTNQKYTAFRGDYRDTVRSSWKINDKVTLIHQYDKDDFKFDRLKEVGNTLDEKIGQVEKKNYLALSVEHGGNWKSNVFANQLDRDYKKYDNKNKLNTDKIDTFANLGIDSQTSWSTPYGEYVSGFSWLNESFESDDHLNNTNDIERKERNSYSLFAQVKHAVSDKSDAIVGVRQEFITQKGRNNYSELCPQVQFITRTSPDKSWYINVGRSFRMPNMSDLYGNNTLKAPNPNLDPEYGYNYEIGHKWIKPDYSLKAALYHMDFTNYITWKNISGQYYPYNTQFRNTGLELSYERKLSDNLTYTLGASYSNPQEKPEDSDWKQMFGRLQLTGGLDYHKDKVSAQLSYSYLGDRKDDIKPMLPVNLVVGYQADRQTKLTLRVENLLNRNDIVSHGSSRYHALERNYNLSVTTKF